MTLPAQISFTCGYLNSSVNVMMQLNICDEMFIPFVIKFSLIPCCSLLQNRGLVSVYKYVVPFCIFIKCAIYESYSFINGRADVGSVASVLVFLKCGTVLFR